MEGMSYADHPSLDTLSELEAYLERW
jgi:hypothetical protein